MAHGPPSSDGHDGSHAGGVFDVIRCVYCVYGEFMQLLWYGTEY